jgi:hypothetical protein
MKESKRGTPLLHVCAVMEHSDATLLWIDHRPKKYGTTGDNGQRVLVDKGVAGMGVVQMKEWTN